MTTSCQSANKPKPSQIMVWALFALSIGCIIDSALFPHAHGMVPFWIGMAFSVAALAVIIFSKSSGLRFVLPLVLFFVGLALLGTGYRLFFADLEYAILEGDVRLMKRTIRKGASVNQIASTGKTMLTMACDYAHWKGGYRTKEDLEKLEAIIPQMMEILIDNGADIDMFDDFGQAPLHVAAQRKVYPAVRFLLARGADVNLKDREGNTPLHHAVKAPFHSFDDNVIIQIIELLIEAGADVHATNNKGQTPLDLVANEDHPFYGKLAALLRKHGAQE